MLNQLWGWVVAGFMALVAVLLYVTGQREKARRKSEKARAKAHSVQATREVERKVSRERNEVRKQAEKTRQEHEARPDDKRPSGSFRRK